MSSKIRVAILDDHLSIIDGYLFRLNQKPAIHVVATATVGEELEPMLQEHTPDVLLLDVSVPTSKDNPNPFPILHLIPKIIQSYSEMSVLVISMRMEPALIKAVMEAGASGYILKDDYATIQELGNVVMSIATGSIHLSQQAYQQLFDKLSQDTGLTSRQQEALSLCAAYPGETQTELAGRIGVAPSTMRNLLSGAYLRLGVRNRSAAIEKARKLGLITPSTPNPKG